MRLPARLARWLPAVLAAILLFAVVDNLQQLAHKRVQGSQLSVHLLAESPLADQGSLDAIAANADPANLLLLRQRVLALGWVKDASLRRIWPGELRLTIRPREPIAIWDKHHLLSRQAVLVAVPSTAQFARDHSHLTLPRVRAPNSRTAEVAAGLALLQPQLADMDMTIRQFVLEEWGEIRIDTTAGQKILLGSMRLPERLQRLRQLVRAGLAKPNAVSSIDLRYREAVAVGGDKSRPDSKEQ